MKRFALALAAFLLSTSPSATADDGTRLLRMPDIVGNSIAFVYAGDIWIVDAKGGTARQLTTHPGLELFPKFSPDGKWIAFSGEYGGNRQVFVIGVEGGTPRQLTYYNDVGAMPPRGGWDDWVLGWTPDGHDVIFRANRLPWSERMGRYYRVPVEGGLETPLPIPEGGSACLSPDGSRIAYTPIDREFRTWKRYRGGRAQDIWIYDLAKGSAEKITDFEGTDNQPVWIGSTIYFTSDRDERRKLNLWAYDTLTRTTREVTHHDEYDVLWPAGDERRVVYENGGFLYLFDPATERSERVPVHVFGDLPNTYPVLKNVKDRIESADLSPSGVRALFAARGDLYTVPAKEGEIRELTRTQGVRERSPAWSPDGKWIAYLSDRTGEYEIYVRPRDGTGEERQVTKGSALWQFQPVWSPDSKLLAFGDHDRRLRMVDVETGRITELDRGEHGDITSYAWSPDSRFLAYDKPAANQFSQIWIYALDETRAFSLTSELQSNFGAVFDPRGKYLYFLSNRDFNLTFSGSEFSYVSTGPTRVYVGSLGADTPLPFVPKSDEEKAEAEKENEKKKEAKEQEPAPSKEEEKDKDKQARDVKEKEEEEKTKDTEAAKSAKRKIPRVKIDAEGFERRVIAVPGAEAGTYRSLSATEDGIFFLFGAEETVLLKRFDLKDEKEETVLESIHDYVLSRDGKKVLYRKGADYGIVDAKPGQKSSEGRLKLDRLETKIDPRAEWRQIYADAWRTLRDWFYDPNMHGLDWKKMGERYEQLVPYVAHRADLDYLLGELGGELNSGHVYVNAGEYPRVTRIEGGLLGAELTADSSGYYRIAKIFPGENWHPNFRSPLTEPGVKATVGDLILAIDGQTVTTKDNPYRFLEGKADHVVSLLLSQKPDRSGAHEERVRPVDQETNLRYLDWVLERRRRVAEASGGRIGYIHLPNTANEGNRELFKYFYPQAHMDALIVDDRYNGGGFIPDRMIELLNRPLLNYWVRRGVEPQPTPGFAHQGPKVCLINGYSSSGGDAFPYYFKKLGLGKLIGTRTWGGLIGLSGNPGFVDGGSVSVPTFRFLDTEGAWAVEGVGVPPDIEVVDRSDLVAKGQDPSLEKAIELLMQELARNPPKQVEVPPPFLDGR